jgi:hypothetical protein
MTWKWMRREEKQKKEKGSMRMHGKGTLRVENDLRNRKKVEPGTKFTDEKHNRELTVVRKIEAGNGLWFCQSQFKTETLYAYEERFILDNLVYEL